MKGWPQTLLAGAGALFCAFGVWLAFHVYRMIVPLRIDSDPMMFIIQSMDLQTRSQQFTLAAVLFLIGAVFIVGACIVHQLDDDERR